MSDDELALLASQHHLSEYNRLKYGHRGCPVSYTPLSPDIVVGLRERQKKYTSQVLWWPCPAPVRTSPVIPAAEQRAALAAGKTMLHPELQQELSNAISELITVQPSHQIDTSNYPSQVKTSESHPINISQIIPPESLIAISSHLTPCKEPSPVLFEIQFSYSFERIAGYPQLSLADAPVLPRHLASVTPQRKHPSRSSVTGVLSAALSTKISLPPLPIPSSKALLSLKRNLRIHTVSDIPSQATVARPKPTPLPTIPRLSHSRLPSTSTPYTLRPFLAHTRPPTAPSTPNKGPSRQVTTNPRPFKLGNLLLSSCPGKKVRLNGPLRGRSAVCRDLHVDLRRMKLLGTRCLVCCLDDDELEFLVGVSWNEYCQVAHQQGLDVLRIPLPEGLAPLSPKSLDADLERIIERYTLHGFSVLVHCRGGVGRAGLFACCWMLKLGLCGWIETENAPLNVTTIASGADSETNLPLETFRWDSKNVLRRDSLQLVERAIDMVRRRRSVKAVETLEQVQFLVEYADYLRTRGRISSTHGAQRQLERCPQ